MVRSLHFRPHLHLSPEQLARLLYPQTIAFLVGLTAALICVSILVRLKATLDFDLHVTKSFQEWNTPFLNRMARLGTAMGNGSTVIPVAFTALVVASMQGVGKAGVYEVWSLASLPLNVMLKKCFDRERPGEPHVKVVPGPRWGTSYPSGHSMGSAAIYGFLGFLFWLYIPFWPAKVALALVFACLPVWIGLSRIYMGAHWFSDVIGGWSGGLVILVVLASLYVV